MLPRSLILRFSELSLPKKASIIGLPIVAAIAFSSSIQDSSLQRQIELSITETQIVQSILSDAIEVKNLPDFEYEINLAGINKMLAPEIETVFIPTNPELATVSSSMVKEIAKFNGDISKFVPPYVAEAVDAKLKK